MFRSTHPMYNYQKDSCGPVYLTMGDGGNVEGPYRNFVDDLVPGTTNVTYCLAAWGAAISANPYYSPSPSYQTQAHPPGCVITSYQPASGKAGGPGVIPNPVLDPSKSAYFCQSSQPVWSAYRDPSFGFAGMQFLNDTTATFSWYRNIDQNPNGSTLNAVDTTTFTKYTGACQGNTPALESVATTLYSPAPAVFSGQPYNGSGTYRWGANASMLQNATALGLTNPITGTPVAANATNPQWRAGDAFVSYPTGFSAGVQSGDPLPGQIILWTRFQPSNDQSAKAAADPSNIGYTYNYQPAPGYIPIAVTWWLSATNSSASPLASGVYTTDGSRDWTVKLDVSYGTVTQQTTLYYGFSAVDTATSATYTAYGSFRALANTSMSQLNYAVVSCTNWGFGYFNVYNMMSQIDALDVWVHVGDNYYEYKDLYYPGPDAKVRPFVTDPPTELVTLDDYRRRARLYRLDPDMQALGAKVPFIALTDDHDYVNNAWMTFAENHQPSGVSAFAGQGAPPGAGFDTTPYPEGDYYNRIQAALASWYSYMPIREGAVVYSGTGNTGSVAADFAAVSALATATYSGPYFSAGAVTPAYLAAGQIQGVPGSAASNVTALMRWQMAKQQRSFTFPGLLTMALTEDRVAYRTSGNAYDQNGYQSVPAMTSEGPVTNALGALLYGQGTNPAAWSPAGIAGVTAAYAYEKTLSGGACGLRCAAP